jgi:hypothetical protein
MARVFKLSSGAFIDLDAVIAISTIKDNSYFFYNTPVQIEAVGKAHVFVFTITTYFTEYPVSVGYGEHRFHNYDPEPLKIQIENEYKRILRKWSENVDIIGEERIVYEDQ